MKTKIFTSIDYKYNIVYNFDNMYNRYNIRLSNRLVIRQSAIKDEK